MTFLEFLKEYTKIHKWKVALSAILLISACTFLWAYLDVYKNALNSIPLQLPWIFLLICIGLLVLSCLYVRYLYQELNIKEIKELDLKRAQEQINLVKERAKLQKIENPEIAEKVVIEISSATQSLWSSLLTSNGLIASIFLALIILEIESRLWASIFLILFAIVETLLVNNFWTNKRVLTAILQSYNLPESELQPIKFLNGIHRLRSNLEFYTKLSLVGIIVQGLAIFFLILFGFKFIAK